MTALAFYTMNSGGGIDQSLNFWFHARQKILRRLDWFPSDGAGAIRTTATVGAVIVDKLSE